jgi:hypothetical protein
MNWLADIEDPYKMSKMSASFGLSIADETIALTDELLSLLTNNLFSYVQLPNTNYIAKLSKKSLTKLDLVTEFSSSLTENIYSQRSNHKDEFVAQFAELLDNVSDMLTKKNLNLNGIEFSADFKKIFSDPYVLKSNVELLTMLGLHLIKHDVKLLLPIPVPSDFVAYPGHFLLFLKNIMLPNYLLSFDINPHKSPFSSEDVVKILEEFLPMIGVIRFVYDATAGNNLVEANLRDWFKVLYRFGYSKGIVFKPLSTSHDVILSEFQEIVSLLETMAD